MRRHSQLNRLARAMHDGYSWEWYWIARSIENAKIALDFMAAEKSS